MSHLKALAPPLIALLMAAPGCATVGRPASTLLPTSYRQEVGPFLVASNSPIDEDSAPVRQLDVLRNDFETTIGLPFDPTARPVEVYILDDRRSFAHFLSVYYPELPPRRAFFFAQGDRRVVYTYYGDRLDEDLRHEATHALLHGGFPDLPLWLDEGLAEYYEGSIVPGGTDPEHLGRLPDDIASGWTPDLPRLEALGDVRQLTPRDYREAWIWAHYLLNDQAVGRPTLRAYLTALHDGESTPPLSDRLVVAGSGTASVLLAYIDVLRNPNIANAAARPSTLRLQDAPIPVVETRRPRSRLRGAFDFLFGTGPKPSRTRTQAVSIRNDARTGL